MTASEFIAQHTGICYCEAVIAPDGSIEYETPVTYWMPFNGGIGIHDLSKRSSYGGDIYLYNGSHGCINTPMDAVRTIYENIVVNNPVVVY